MGLTADDSFVTGITELNFSDFISPYTYQYNYALRAAGMTTVRAAAVNGRQ